MDALSITVSVTTLLLTAAKIIRAAADLRSKYKDAAFMLSAIASECTVVNTSLAIMQSLMISDLEILRSRMTESILSTFEAALTGCTLTMSVIEEELHSLLVTDDDGNLKARRVKYILEQEHLKEMLHQIRGQQIGISLLLQTYQLGTNAEVKKMTSDNNDLLRKIANNGRKFYVESIHESERCLSAAFSVRTHEGSIFEMSSTIDSRQFDFDDQITSALAYRRALASLRQKDQLLGIVQPSEKWNSVQAHKIEPTQALATNGTTELTTVASDRDTATSFEKSSASVTDIFETASALHSFKSIHTTYDASDTQHKDGARADISSTECSPRLFASDQSRVQQTTENDLGSEKIDQDTFLGIPYSLTPAPPSYLWSKLEIKTESNSGTSNDPIVTDPRDPAIQHNMPVLQNALLQIEKLAATVPSVAQNPWDDFRNRIPRRKAAIGFQVSHARAGDSSHTIKDPLQTSDNVRKLKFVMLGDSFSGKTYALMKYLRGDTYGIPYAPTVYGNYTSDLRVDDQRYRINWTDTPGQEIYDSLRSQAYTGCHVALLVFAIDCPDSFANIKEKWAREIYHHQPLVPKILVGCKSDLRYNLKTIEDLGSIWQEPVAREQAEALASYLGHESPQTEYSSQMRYMECSSLTGEGIEELFEEAARLAICYANDCVNTHALKSTKKRKRLSELFRRSQAQLVMPMQEQARLVS